MDNIAFIVSGRGEEREEDMMRQPPCPGCAPLFFWEVAPVSKNNKTEPSFHTRKKKSKKERKGKKKKKGRLTHSIA